MNILVKIWTILLLGLLASNTTHAGEVLDQINATKTLKVATNANWPPQSFTNENKMKITSRRSREEVQKRQTK